MRLQSASFILGAALLAVATPAAAQSIPATSIGTGTHTTSTGATGTNTGTHATSTGTGGQATSTGTGTHTTSTGTVIGTGTGTGTGTQTTSTGTGSHTVSTGTGTGTGTGTQTTSTGAFDKLSPGGQKIATSLYSSQNPPRGTRALTLDQIAAMKSHEGWGRVFKEMKADGLVQAKNLGQVVSGHARSSQTTGSTQTTNTTRSDHEGRSEHFEHVTDGLRHEFHRMPCQRAAQETAGHPTRAIGQRGNPKSARKENAAKDDAAVVNNWANCRKQEHPAREQDC